MNMFVIDELKGKKINKQMLHAIVEQKQSLSARKNAIIIAGDTLLKI
jgi:hypothetical protein